MQFFFDDYEQITIETGQITAEMASSIQLVQDLGEFELRTNIAADLKIENVELLFGYRHYLEFGQTNQKYPIQFRYIVKTERFETEYISKELTEMTLGAIYAKEQTIFRLWAPISYQVHVVNIETNEAFPMKRLASGLFELTMLGDLHGFKYLYEVENDEKFKVVDPYSVCSGPNASSSIVTDFNRFVGTTNLRAVEPKDLLLYEVHVRDFSSDQSIAFKHPQKFLSLTQTGLVNRYGDKVGFDYLKQLGISHLQLLPIFDFGSVADNETNLECYNWGYDPVQFNCPKPLYGSDPTNPFSAIIDLKKLINFYHLHNIGINMDVVYNHVYSGTDFSLHKIVPYYFMRLTVDKQISNGSFCGNDFESNSKMGRKFIVDSLVHLTKNYGFDGYRFDLMGIMDIETMNEIAKKIKAINPQILLYGEGWKMPTALEETKQATMENFSRMPDYAFFNDLFRDSVRGGMQNYQKIGIAGGRRSSIVSQLFQGAGFLNPYQSVNYVSCHDNHTLYDRLLLNYSELNELAYCQENQDDFLREYGSNLQINNGQLVNIMEYQIDNRIKLCYIMVILSQGIPLIHAGCEFKRTKKLHDNTYNQATSLNCINWELVTINQHLIEFIQKLIEIRRNTLEYNQVFYEDYFKNVGDNLQALIETAIQTRNLTKEKCEENIINRIIESVTI